MSETFEQPIDTEPKLTEEQKEVKALFRAAFRYAQGNPTLHDEITDWLIEKGHYKDIDPSSEVPDYLLAIVPPSKHKDIALAGEAQIKDRYKHLQRTLQQIERYGPLGPDVYVQSITSGMLGRDLDYQGRPRPARVLTEHVETDSDSDPHASFVRRYGLQSANTGSEPLNELFREVALQVGSLRPQIEPPFSPSSVLQTGNDRLYLLREGWERNHPGETFFGDKTPRAPREQKSLVPRR